MRAKNSFTYKTNRLFINLSTFYQLNCRQNLYKRLCQQSGQNGIILLLFPPFFVIMFKAAKTLARFIDNSTALTNNTKIENI